MYSKVRGAFIIYIYSTMIITVFAHLTKNKTFKIKLQNKIDHKILIKLKQAIKYLFLSQLHRY